MPLTDFGRLFEQARSAFGEGAASELVSSLLPQPPAVVPDPGVPLPRASGLPEFFGNRPGFDLGDIPDILGRIFGPGVINPLDLDLRTFPIPVPGGAGRGGGEEGALRDLLLGRNGNGGAAPGRARMPSGIVIGGTCPGLWHTTRVRTVFDSKTGAARQVGGNRTPNRLSLVQDDSGDLQLFAPVEIKRIGFKFRSAMTGNPRARTHVHRVRHRAHRRRARRTSPRRKIRATSHGHHLTARQLAAGFGGKAAMRR